MEQGGFRRHWGWALMSWMCALLAVLGLGTPWVTVLRVAPRLETLAVRLPTGSSFPEERPAEEKLPNPETDSQPEGHWCSHRPLAYRGHRTQGSLWPRSLSQSWHPRLNEATLARALDEARPLLVEMASFRHWVLSQTW